MGMTFWLPQAEAVLATVCKMSMRKALPHGHLNTGLEALSTCISHRSIAHLLSYKISVLHQMALVKSEVQWRAVSAADPRTITFSVRQLQSKFKHAVDFGVMGKYSRQQATMFERAICAHIEDETTLMIPGTYRGEPVTHFVNPQTGLNVMRDAQNAFVSGWRLTPIQLANVLVRRSL